jgi:putative peptidoglycan lipid II flippase
MFARLDVQGPRISALMGLCATLAAGLASLHWLAGSDRLIGLSGALLAGDVAAAATAILLLRRAVRPAPLMDRRRLWAAALASTVMLPLLIGGSLLGTTLHGNRFQELVIVCFTSVLALGLFAITLKVQAIRRPRVVT